MTSTGVLFRQGDNNEDDEDNKISALYSSKRWRITGSEKMTVRDWLNTKSFKEQYEFGLKAVENVQKGVW